MIDKIDKPWAKLTKKERDRTEINRIINIRDITSSTTEIQRIRDYYE